MNDLCNHLSKSSSEILYLDQPRSCLTVKAMNNKKALVFAVICLLIVSSLTLATQAVAAQTSPSPTPNIPSRLTEASWIKMRGIVEKLDDVGARGQLQTLIRTAVRENAETKQLVSTTVMWTTNLAKDLQPQAPEEKTFNFHIARLPADAVTSFTSNQGTIEIKGTWKLADVTVTITVEKDAQGTITGIHKQQDIKPSTATGTLTIENNKFTQTIGDDTVLTGSIYRSLTRSWYNPYKLSDGTTQGSTITRTDLKTVATNYGASPGWGNYNLDMDFNNNYRVDIADISSVAAKM